MEEFEKMHPVQSILSDDLSDTLPDLFRQMRDLANSELSGQPSEKREPENNTPPSTPSMTHTLEPPPSPAPNRSPYAKRQKITNGRGSFCLGKQSSLQRSPSETPISLVGTPRVTVTPATPNEEYTPPSSPPFQPDQQQPTPQTPLRIPPCNINPFSPERNTFSSLSSPARLSETMFAMVEGTYSRYACEFQELEEIGGGSFSRVFKCRSRVDGWLYAVKQARRAFRSWADRQNTLKEVFALAALGSHPHIVRYYSAWVEENHLYIQTEYCGGGSLADQLKKGRRFSEKELCKILRQVCLGLRHIHSKNLAHLDVKPENIYLDINSTGKCQYKIGDLGLITLADATDFSEGDSRYLSRDLFTASVVDCRQLTKADIFSLGCSVYELALGRSLPSRGEEWNQIREANIKLPQQYSQDFESLLKSMLHTDAEKRPSAEALLCEPLLHTAHQRESALLALRAQALQTTVQALKEENATLQAELKWRRDVMDGQGLANLASRLLTALATLQPLLPKLALLASDLPSAQLPHIHSPPQSLLASTTPAYTGVENQPYCLEAEVTKEKAYD
jgi:serine/threonine protein kinase